MDSRTREKMKRDLMAFIQKRNARKIPKPKKMQEAVLYDMLKALPQLPPHWENAHQIPKITMQEVANTVMRSLMPILYQTSIARTLPPEELRLPQKNTFWSMHRSIGSLLHSVTSEEDFIKRFRGVILQLLVTKPPFPHHAIIEHLLETVRAGTQQLRDVLPRIASDLDLPHFEKDSPMVSYIHNLLLEPPNPALNPSATLTLTDTLPYTVVFLIQSKEQQSWKVKHEQRERVIRVPRTCSFEYLMYYIAEQIQDENDIATFTIYEFHKYRRLDITHLDAILTFDDQPRGPIAGRAPYGLSEYLYYIKCNMQTPEFYFDTTKRIVVSSAQHQMKMFHFLQDDLTEPIWEAYNQIGARQDYKFDMIFPKYRPNKLTLQNLRALAREEQIPLSRKQDIITELKKRKRIEGDKAGMHLKHNWDSSVNTVRGHMQSQKMCPSSAQVALHFTRHGPDVLVSSTLKLSDSPYVLCVPMSSNISDLHAMVDPQIQRLVPGALYSYIQASSDNQDALYPVPIESILKHHDQRTVPWARYRIRIQIEASPSQCPHGCVDMASQKVLPPSTNSPAATYYQAFQKHPYMMMLWNISQTSMGLRTTYLQATPRTDTCPSGQQGIVFVFRYSKEYSSPLPGIQPQFSHQLDIFDTQRQRAHTHAWFPVCVPKAKVTESQLQEILKPQLERQLGRTIVGMHVFRGHRKQSDLFHAAAAYKSHSLYVNLTIK